MRLPTPSSPSLKTSCSIVSATITTDENIMNRDQQQPLQKHQHPLQEQMKRSRNLPTMIMKACSDNRAKSRDQMFCSPPTVPYVSPADENSTRSSSKSNDSFHCKSDSMDVKGSSQADNQDLEKNRPLWQEMNSVPVEDVIRWKEFRRKQKSLQQSAITETGTREDEKGDSACERRNGSDNGEDIPQLGSLSLSWSLSSSSSMSDSSKKHDSETGKDVNQDVEVSSHKDVKNENSPREAIEIDDAGFPVTPVSAPSSVPEYSSEAFFTASDATGGRNSHGGGKNGNLQGDVEIDDTTRSCRNGEGNCDFEEHASSSEVPTEVMSNTMTSRLVASSINSHPQNKLGVVQENVASEVPTKVASNTPKFVASRSRQGASMKMLVEVVGEPEKADSPSIKHVQHRKSLIQKPDHTTASSFGSDAASATPSHAPSPSRAYSPEVSEKPLSATPSSAPTASASSASMSFTPLENGVSQAPIAPSPLFDESPISCSRELPKDSGTLLSSSGKKTDHDGRSNRIEKKYEQVWDDTRTTLDVDQLERVLSSDEEDWDVRRPKISTIQGRDTVLLKIPPNEKSCSDNVDDLSIIASNWDPLQVSTINESEGDEDKSGGVEKPSVPNEIGNCGVGGDGGAGIDNDGSNGHIVKVDDPVASFDGNKGNNEESFSAPSTEVSTFEHSSPIGEGPKNIPSKSSPASSNEVKCSLRDDAPTLTEVKKFMTRLEILREERMNATKSRSAKNSRSNLSNPAPIQNSIDTVCDESDVIVKQENLEFMRSLLEKKDKLRQHKLDAERKKQELDARLKSMRSKVYEQPKIEEAAPKFENCDRNEQTTIGQSSTKGPISKGPIESPRIQSSPMMPGARWSGGLARWSPTSVSTSASTMRTNVDTQSHQFKQVDSSTLAIGNGTDDFSFKPTPTAGVKHFSFSPISTAANSKLTFVFSASPKTAESSNKLEQCSGDAQQHSTQLENVELLSPSVSVLRSKYASSKKQAPSIGRGLLTPNQRNSSTPKDPSPMGHPPTPDNGDAVELEKHLVIATSSPDLSEGDKGGGGFGPGCVTGLGDKSVVSKSSSKFVELGGTESCNLVVKENEAQNLLGVTVVGSKEKKKGKKKKPTLVCDTVDEQSKDGSCESMQEISTRVTAPDPPGENANNIEWKRENSLVRGNNPVTSVGALTVDKLDDADTTGFESVMKRVGNFDLTPRSRLVSLTPRSGVSVLNAATPRVSHQSSSARKIGMGPRDVDTEARADNAANLPTFAPSNSLVNELRSKFESKPEGDKVSVDEDLDQNKPLDQCKIGVIASGSSEDTISIKELRKKFEPRNGAKRIGSGEQLREIQSSTGKPAVNVTENQAQSSLESNTYDTNESSLNKSSMDDTDGENSLDTKRVLSYARMLEKRGVPNNCFHGANIPEQRAKSSEGDSFKSFDNTIDKSLSSKENVVGEPVAGNPRNTHISPVKLRKMAFEQHQPELCISSNTPTSATVEKKNPESDAPPKKKNHNALGRNQSTCTTDSIKDRIASFSYTGHGKVAIQPAAMATSNYSTKQQVSSNITGIKNTPHVSHLWPVRSEMPFTQAENFNRNVISGNSNCPLQVQDYGYPVHTPIHAKAQPTQPLAGNFIPNTPAWARGRSDMVHQMYPNQYAPIQSQHWYDSPKAQQFDDDDDDGITLSPTCSEVSGLTTPTCLISVTDEVNDAKSKMSNKSHFSKQSDVFDNITLSSMPPSSPYQEAMSPIARHRQQKSTFSSKNKLSKHPYMQRVNSKEKISNKKDSDPATDRSKSKSRGKDEMSSKQNNVRQTSGAQGNISRRDMIVSKIKGKKSAILNSPVNIISNDKQHLSPHYKQSAKHQSSNGANAPKNVGNLHATSAVQGISCSSPKQHQTQSSGRCGKGRVAERIAAVNHRHSSDEFQRKAVNKQLNNRDRFACSLDDRKQSNASWIGRTRAEENESSLATRDCLRVD